MKCNLNKEELNFEWLMFDFDNTLVDFHESSKLSFDQTFKDFGLELKSDYYKIYGGINAKIWGEFEQKLITAEDIRKRRFTEFFEAVDIKGIDGYKFNAQYLKNIVKFTHIDSAIVDMLIRLKEKYRLSIITNGLKEVQRARIEKCGITQLFESIIVSDEESVAKPDKKYFDIAFQSIDHKIDKSKILVIGDSLKSDIAGAKLYGLKSCYIDAKGTAEKSAAEIIIKNVLQLEPILTDFYIPVDCDWYDYLEIYCMHKSKVRLEYFKEEELIQCETIIEDLYTKNKEEFAIISGGIHIRLDRINLLQITN